MTLATEFLATQPVPKFMQDLHTCHGRSEPNPIVGSKELLERRKLALEFLIVDEYQRNGHQANDGDQHQTPSGKQPAEPRQQSIEYSLRVDASEPDGEHVNEFPEQFLLSLLISASTQLPTLATGMRDNQAATVKHANELLQILQGNALRCKFCLKGFPNLLKRGLSIQHIENGKLLLVKAEVVESYRFFHDPIRTPIITMTTRFQVRTTTQPQWAHRAVDE